MSRGANRCKGNKDVKIEKAQTDVKRISVLEVQRYLF